MLKTIAISTLAVSLAAAAGAAINRTPTLYEEAIARQEEGRIITRPIAGIENKYWFNYGNNVFEARKELTSDLRRASDTEDLRDAWDEYRVELVHERTGYIEKMAKRGYRYGVVEVAE